MHPWSRLGWCALLAPPLAFTCILLSIHLSPSFSWQENALSDLGVGKTSSLFNFGLMAAGLLLLLFSLASLLLLRGERPGLFSSLLLAADSLCLFGIGLFPENWEEVHLLFSVLFFLLFPLFALAFSALLWEKGLRRGALLTLLLSPLTILPWLYPWRGWAIPETLSSSAASLYVMILGALMLSGRPPYAPRRG
jgi:hypothetical membrane protein